MAKAKRKKRFFEIELPLINKQTQLQAYELKDLDGGKNTLIKLKLIFENEKIKTIPNEIKLLPCYLKRAVRKGTNYVEDSFSTNCKDAQLKVKPFLVTRKKVSRAVRRALRKLAKKELINYAKEKTTEEIFKDILRNQLQKPLSLKLKKIYPLSLCEIRVLKVEK